MESGQERFGLIFPDRGCEAWSMHIGKIKEVDTDMKEHSKCLLFKTNWLYLKTQVEMF